MGDPSRGGKGGSAAASFSVQAAKEEPTVLFGNSPLCSAVLCSYFVTTGYCSLVEECTDSSPLWVLLQLLTPGAGVFSAVGGESDRIECALFLQGCAVRISTGCILSFRGQRCMKNV